MRVCTLHHQVTDWLISMKLRPHWLIQILFIFWSLGDQMRICADEYFGETIQATMVIYSKLSLKRFLWDSYIIILLFLKYSIKYIYRSIPCHSGQMSSCKQSHESLLCWKSNSGFVCGWEIIWETIGSYILHSVSKIIFCEQLIWAWALFLDYS